MDISKQELEGALTLKGFDNLKELICSENQITNLYLKDYSKLEKLKCDQNNFTNNLNFLTTTTNLKELNINDCPKLKGSLKPLQNMNNLEQLSISHTDISEGLEDLTESCKKLYCDKSMEIVKELDKSKFLEEEQDQ